MNAGNNNVGGSGNTFVGRDTNFNFLNQSGNANTLLGTNAKIGADNLSNATAIGSRAQVTKNNSLVLGSINGVNSAVADTNVGIGTTAPRTKLHLTNGKIYVEANGQGVILKSPGGACFELTVSDIGALISSPVACP